MKLFQSFLVVALMFAGVSFVKAQKQVAQNKGFHITFETERIDLGSVKRGEVKKFDFVFTNTGTEAIQIDLASSCDCTTLDYPRGKVLPGKKGVIHVTFDSAEKENSEIVDVDLYFKNIDPKTQNRYVKYLEYEFVFSN